MVTQNKCLNFLKGIACIGVIFLHFAYPGIVGDIIDKIARFAVPLFFMISGYFLWNEDKDIMLKKIPGKIKRLLIISTSCTLAHIIYAFVMERHLLGYFSYRSVIKLILFNDSSELFGAWHVWFLLALIYTYGIIYVIYRFNIKISLKYVAITLLAIRSVIMIITPYGLLLNKSFILAGIPYVMLGMHIARMNVNAIRSKIKQLVILGFIGLVFSYIGLTKLAMADIAEIGTIIYSIALFLLAVCNPNKSIWKPIEKIGERYYLIIYVIHILVGRIIYNWFIMIGADISIILWVAPLVVIIVTIGLSIGLMEFCRFVRTKRLKRETD